MKKSILAAAISAAIFVSTYSYADTASMNADVSGMGVLQNEWVKAGINGSKGTFGSGGNTSPGLLFDPAGSGTFDPGYDYLTPGSPFDGFSVKVDGTNYTNNNQGSAQIAGDGNGLTLGTNSLSWTGGVAGVFDITNTYSLAPTRPYIDITSSITMGVSATSLSFAKFIDPDSQGMPGDSSATDNVLGYGVIPSTNVAFSEATVSRYALGIYTTDTNVTAGVNGWDVQADSYNGTNYYKPLLDADGNYQWTSPGCENISWGCPYEPERDADGNPIKQNYGNGDDTIGISWRWANVSVGDILTASYAYIFGPSAFDAASDAVEGGAGGGDTTTTSSWGTVTDVGSATDAAESGASGGGSTPEPETPAVTVTGTSTTTISTTAEAPSTTLPVLTASITHHTASDDGAVQTIARERTTSVTTPIAVTTTSFDRTTTTYSDGSETVVDGEATSVVAIRNDVETTVTDPGSFVARADQMTTLQSANNSLFRGIDFTRIDAIGNDINYANGMSGSLSGAVIGGTRELDNGWSVGAGIAKVNGRASGVDGSGSSSSTLVNLHGGKTVEQGKIDFSLTGSQSDFSINRTIGTFSNAGATSGDDVWGTVRFTGNGDKVRPIIGYTVGTRTMDGYTETGSIQSARTIAGTKDNYEYGTIGLEATVGPVNVYALHNTDDVNTAGVSIAKQHKNITYGVSVARTEGDAVKASTQVTAGINVKF